MDEEREKKKKVTFHFSSTLRTMLVYQDKVYNLVELRNPLSCGLKLESTNQALLALF